MNHNNAISLLGADTVFDFEPLVKTIFQESNNDDDFANERKFEIMPDSCSILKERQGQIDFLNLLTGNVVSVKKLYK